METVGSELECIKKDNGPFVIINFEYDDPSLSSLSLGNQFNAMEKSIIPRVFAWYFYIASLCVLYKSANNFSIRMQIYHQVCGIATSQPFKQEESRSNPYSIIRVTIVKFQHTMSFYSGECNPKQAQFDRINVLFDEKYPAPSSLFFSAGFVFSGGGGGCGSSGKIETDADDDDYQEDDDHDARMAVGINRQVRLFMKNKRNFFDGKLMENEDHHHHDKGTATSQQKGDDGSEKGEEEKEIVLKKKKIEMQALQFLNMEASGKLDCDGGIKPADMSMALSVMESMNMPAWNPSRVSKHFWYSFLIWLYFFYIFFIIFDFFCRWDIIQKLNKAELDHGSFFKDSPSAAGGDGGCGL